MLPPNVFLDTAFALALANPKDLLHERAIHLADQAVRAASTNTQRNSRRPSLVIRPVR